MWQKTFTRPANIQYDELIRGKVMVSNPYFSSVIKSYVALPSGNGFLDFYFKKNEWSKLMEKMANEILSHKDPACHQQQLFRQLSKEYFKSVSVFKNNLAKLSDYQLLQFYNSFVKATKKMWFFFYSPWAVNEMIEPIFAKRIRNQYQDSANFILSAVGSPTKEIRFNKQLRILLQLKLNGSLNKNQLRKHALGWGYLNIYVPHDKPYGYSDFLKMVRGINPKKKLRDMENTLKTNQQNFRKALNLLKKESELTKMAKLINFYVYFRNERMDIHREATMLAKPFYQELDRRIGLKNYQSSFLTVQELINFLKQGIKLPLSTIIKRSKFHYYWCQWQGKKGIFYDKTGIKELYCRYLKPKKSNKTIKGVIAQAGKIITGKAKIIVSTKEAGKFKKNDVLITPMTHPEYIGIMKKAAAIITDEGGITCHAAIISRELGIPCIIGTKIATQVLKDGDLVEVDTSKGIVRKLK